MRVQYTFANAPKTTRVYDTQISLLRYSGLPRPGKPLPSQAEWDRRELRHFEQEKKKGLILDYRII